MNETEGKIGRVSYRLRWEISELDLNFQIRRTGFLNRQCYGITWRMKNINEIWALHEAATSRQVNRDFPFPFIRLIWRLLSVRFVSNLGQIGEKIGPETLTAYLGSMKGKEILIFQCKAPGWCDYTEVPLETFRRMAEHIEQENK